MPFFITFLIFLICNCSPISKNNLKYTILDNTAVQVLENEKILSGTGRILFNQPLFELYSTELYFIKTEFINENSSFVLHSHFTGFENQDGLQIFFERNQEHLIIKASTPNYPPQLLYENKTYFIKNNALAIYIQVTNGTEYFVDIKVWDIYSNPSGYLRTKISSLSDKNLIASSNSTTFYSRGQGILWGVALNKVHIIQIQRESINQK